MKRPKPPVSRQKKWLIISVLITLGVITIGTIYTIVASSQWSAQARALQEQLESIESAQSQVGDQKTLDERLQHIDSLPRRELGNCEGSWWYGWTAGVVDSARDAQRRCQVAREEALGVQSDMRTVSTYLAEERKVIDVLSSLRINKDEKDWQETAPKQVATALKRLKPLELTNAGAREIQSLTVERVEALETAWKSLKAASEKEDRSAYNKAMGQLTQAYDDLADITKLSDEQIEDLLTSII